MRQIGVLVIEDQPVMREGLRAILGPSGDVMVVGEVDSGEAAVRALASRTAEVVMLDLDLGGEDGFAVIARIAQVAPGAKVLLFTALRDPQRHWALLLAGVRGVVTKDKAGDIVLKAIRRVASGELWFERQVLERAVSRSMSRGNDHPPRREDLTEREGEVIALIGEGLKNAQIAKRLCISERTVRNHLTSIFDKIGVSDRLGLLVHAYRLGLLAMPSNTPSTI